MRSKLLLVAGAVMLIAAAAGFVIVPEHKPSTRGVEKPASADRGQVPVPGPNGPTVTVSVPTGWSRTAYDAALIGTWAILIVGLLTAAVSLIGLAKPQRN